jgi:uncharacterized protein (DUF1015 family)
MAEVKPLRGVRFNPRASGPIGSLIAPPYDVATESGDSAEFNIRKIESVDLGAGNDHALAARRFRSWLKQGVLRADDDPMIYVHRHRFSLNGVTTERTGLIARVRLADWSERIVLPHERTTPGPREERRQRLRAVQANLSPLYLLFRDPSGEIRDLISRQARATSASYDRDPMGGAHDLYASAQTRFHDQLARLFADRTLFMADGHHRYEAALEYRDERRESTGNDADAPSEFVLALLAAVEDPGVAVHATHRLIVGEQTVPPEVLLGFLRQWFSVRAAETSELPATREFVARVVLPGSHGIWDFYARPKDPHLTLLPQDRGAAWRSLGVVAVEGVLDRLAGDAIRAGQLTVLPIVDDAHAVSHVDDGRARAAFLLPPPSLDRLLAVAEEGDMLPAKSTWFDPKAPAGLVISDLRL